MKLDPLATRSAEHCAPHLLQARSAARIVHVAWNVAPLSGSTFTMIPRLCRLLEEEGLAVELLSTDEDTAANRHEVRNHFPTHCFRKGRLGAALGRSAPFEAAIAELCDRSDVLHVHGMWRRSLITALTTARRKGVPAVVSPMGLFAPKALAISSLRKRAYWHLLQRQAMDGLACYHATSQSEHDHMRAFGIRNPIAVIPLGVDIPMQTPQAISDDAARTLLCIGRISPIKNLCSLVRAWRSVQHEFPEANLRIVGPDDRGHAALIANTARELGAMRISIEPGVWGDARQAAFEASHCVILPSLSESFGLVVPEAMAMSRPVVATTGTPWKLVSDSNCGWWVDPSPDAIAQAIREALNLPAQTLREMGERGRQLATERLCWTEAIPRFAALYEWILGGGQPPEFLSV